MPYRPALRILTPALFLAATATCFIAGLGLAAALSAPPPKVADPCALSAGFDLAAVPEADRGPLVRRAMACVDYEHGRITGVEYRGVPAPVAVTQPPATIVIPTVRTFAQPPPPLVTTPVLWASSVRAVSSEYSDDDWSAQRALGEPDAAADQDDVNAWASIGEDDRVEFLEVGFPAARRLSAIEIRETYNPGAVSRVELIGADGSRGVVSGRVVDHRVELGGCTAAEIVAVRVTIDSPAVEGWNEIDAIGGVLCAP